MRHVVVYSSMTGNTRAVAEAIHRIMPPGTGIYPVREAPHPEEFAFLALGFWVHRAKPDPRMLRYMEMVRGKRVAIFGTLAAYPDSAHAGEVIAAAHACLAGNTIIGSFLCQGRLDPKRLERRLRDSDAGGRHPMTPERRARLLAASHHPNEEDFVKAQAAFTDFLRGVESGSRQPDR